MTDIGNRWKSITNRSNWAARGASFVAKAKATKAVWFPPKPAETGKKAASTAKKATAKTSGAGKKATSKATKKTTSASKKATKKTGAARKTAGS